MYTQLFVSNRILYIVNPSFLGFFYWAFSKLNSLGQFKVLAQPKFPNVLLKHKPTSEIIYAYIFWEHQRLYNTHLMVLTVILMG